jgi:hypothetical protein
MRRRKFIGLLGGIAAFPAAAAAQQTEVEKLSKAQAQYQDSPKGIAMYGALCFFSGAFDVFAIHTGKPLRFC